MVALPHRFSTDDASRIRHATSTGGHAWVVVLLSVPRGKGIAGKAFDPGCSGAGSFSGVLDSLHPNLFRAMDLPNVRIGGCEGIDGLEHARISLRRHRNPTCEKQRLPLKGSCRLELPGGAYASGQVLKWMGGAAAYSAALPRWANPFVGVGPQQSDALWSERVGQLEPPGPGEILLTAIGDMIISSAANARPEPQVQQMYRVMREADLAFGNCEQAIASVGYIEPKPSVMGWPSILDDFKASVLTSLPWRTITTWTSERKPRYRGSRR